VAGVIRLRRVTDQGDQPRVHVAETQRPERGFGVLCNRSGGQRRCLVSPAGPSIHRMRFMTWFVRIAGIYNAGAIVIS
jgi:hypothetical protein